MLAKIDLLLLQFNSILNTIFSSPPTVAMIVGTILDNTLDAHDARDDRGVGWWHPFQHRKGDSRNEEFYSFPLRINEYMPRRYSWLDIHVLLDASLFVHYYFTWLLILKEWLYMLFVAWKSIETEDKFRLIFCKVGFDFNCK